MNGNTHMPHECPYCWRVLYSKGALTYHMNEEHWQELDNPYCEYAFGQFECGNPVKRQGELCRKHRFIEKGRRGRS